MCERNAGHCFVGRDKFYDIEEDEKDNSPLTGEKDYFTCENIEVYKIIPSKYKKLRDHYQSKSKKEENKIRDHHQSVELEIPDN